MRFFLPKKNIAGNLTGLLQRAGYFGINDHLSGKSSYVRRLSKMAHYPRWHLYLEENGDNVIFNLHLDQKQASYEGVSAHSGDYEGGEVRDEAEKLNRILQGGS